ncbi:hypothetical protein BDW72DRAFT_214565 [Aspergillus terricola var. indicus]
MATAYILAFLATALASYILYRCLLPAPIPQIPYNVLSAKSVLGDIPALLSHLSADPTHTFTTYATFLLRKLNSPLIQIFTSPICKPTLILGDYETAYSIFVHKTREFDRSPTVSYMLSGFIPQHHILRRTDEKWKAQRRLILGAMSARYIYGVLSPVIERKVATLVELWRAKCRSAKGRPWSATDDVYILALEGIMAFSFGEGSGADSLGGRVECVRGWRLQDKGARDQPVAFPEGDLNEVLRATLEVTRTMGELKGSLVPRLRWEIVRRKQRIKDAIMALEKNVQRELANAVETLHANKGYMAASAVEHMVAHERDLAQKEGRRPDYFSRVMVDEITGFTIAAYETTGTTLCWGFKYLTDYPQIQAKLRLALEAEYTAAIPKGRSPTIQEIIGIDIPYLEATVQEILRFANPATAVDRQALVDTEILGYAVPKGTIVTCILPQPALISPVDLAKLSALKPEETAPWDNSDLACFNPDRWIQDGQFSPGAAPQVAFGLGPRACPGRRLAYLEIKAVLIGVVWNFELLPCPLELSGYEKVVLATQKPKQCFLCVREITRSPLTEI